MTDAIWRGCDQHGIGQAGRVSTGDIETLVARLWRKGWRRLSVELDGREVASIGERDGVRLWWTEVSHEGQ